MSPSRNFSARAEPSYEGSEPSRAGALQFSNWNRADIFDNMYVKILQIFNLFPNFVLYLDSNQFHDNLFEYVAQRVFLGMNYMI